MARHRWATGERTPGPDRLDRVLKLQRAKPHTDQVWAEADGEGDYSATDGTGGLPDSGADGGGLPRVERRPSGRRWVATRRAALMAAGCALVVGGWQFISADHDLPEVVPIGPPASAATDAPTGAQSSDGATILAEEEHATEETAPGAGDGQVETVVVHVAGAVQAPGVVETAAGSRVFEVLEKAGGALPEAELSAVNLAAVVQDGQQILIPRVGEAPQPVNAAIPPEPGTQGALVNLNTADVTELEELPKVGPVLAGRIVEWRTQHGPFARPEDLDAVPGIGPAMLESLVPLVTV